MAELLSLEEPFVSKPDAVPVALSSGAVVEVATGSVVGSTPVEVLDDGLGSSSVLRTSASNAALSRVHPVLSNAGSKRQAALRTAPRCHGSSRCATHGHLPCYLRLMQRRLVVPLGALLLTACVPRADYDELKRELDPDDLFQTDLSRRLLEPLG